MGSRRQSHIRRNVREGFPRGKNRRGQYRNIIWKVVVFAFGILWSGKTSGTLDRSPDTNHGGISRMVELSRSMVMNADISRQWLTLSACTHGRAGSAAKKVQLQRACELVNYIWHFFLASGTGISDTTRSVQPHGWEFGVVPTSSREC